jgi:hypothetical protein
MGKNSLTVARWSLILLLGLWMGCSSMLDKNAGTASEFKPPFPRTKSILPLALGNTWLFAYTEYDSLGSIINPGEKAMDLHLSISGGYGIVDDTSLVPVTYDNYQNTYSTYVYQFEWEERKKGFLVVYRDLYPLQKRGLYVVGDYKDGKARLYSSEKLWLAYPADVGKTWQFSLSDSADSSNTSTMELLSAKERFYFSNSTTMTALSFCDCYVYKETIGASVYYYYYNEQIGQLGYLEYADNKLRVTYLLKSFSEGRSSK